ncbi:hypothetical protein [Oligoflexus tunisiensis]|uniref:hypothetical protein n=1 Tax=Oligoflexus tunisiensis TaxID=708132 RepID=UPI00159F1A14|nr:hypothetical protein [Oligoflexus tunisiensis]
MRFGRYIVGLPEHGPGFIPQDQDPLRSGVKAADDNVEVDDNGPAHAEADAMV